MSPYNIMLADDHVLVRQGLRRIIEAFPNLKVVAEVGDGVKLLQLMDGIIPDMVVLDISMPNLGGLEAVSEIKMRHPKVKVLMLTMYRDKEYLNQALSSGADGYILKDDADTELFAAITLIREGLRYVSPSLSGELADILIRTKREEAETAGGVEGLTHRELEIIKMVAEGKTSRECADILCISARTVEHHRSNIMSKLKMEKTVDLVKYAMNKGYI
jgi:DNA-binding NarL/FixJ family response regulator